MKLSTPVNIPEPKAKFSYETKLAGIGSCFAQYIMEYFQNLGFDISYNPNGIVYNSFSISSSINHICNKIPYSDNDYIYHNKLWHSWEHHGSYSKKDKNSFIDNLVNSKDNFLSKLKKTDIFILTPSSSVVYCLKDSDRIVANCHKYPGNNFYTKLLSREENFKLLTQTLKHIREINNKCLIVLTLSPVRHYPGNLILNAKSKANILSAIYECIGNDSNSIYFPSYEILLDELRDYRFYNDDMLHPSDLARRIIFDKFIDTYFDNKCKENIKVAEKKYKVSKHRQLNKND
ncbi:MAG TPA: GSCFA domain-containing protein [Victivallales bacterium]|nr:GSCFA domain-containing protein [Victivallales bacterium]